MPVIPASLGTTGALIRIVKGPRVIILVPTTILGATIMPRPIIHGEKAAGNSS
jgi:hypothetical protein